MNTPMKVQKSYFKLILPYLLLHKLKHSFSPSILDKNVLCEQLSSLGRRSNLDCKESNFINYMSKLNNTNQSLSENQEASASHQDSVVMIATLGTAISFFILWRFFLCFKIRYMASFARHDVGLTRDIEP